MRPPFADSPEFRRLLDDGEADIARVALEIARDAYPDVDPEAGLARIDALAERARGRCAPVEGYLQVIGQINWVLFVEEGYGAVSVRDLEKSAAFYQAVFGLSHLGYDHQPMGSAIYLTDGITNFALLCLNKPGVKIGANHCGFQVAEMKPTESRTPQ